MNEVLIKTQKFLQSWNLYLEVISNDYFYWFTISFGNGSELSMSLNFHPKKGPKTKSEIILY